jgi:flagellar hook-associated protein 3 FlgL
LPLRAGVRRAKRSGAPGTCDRFAIRPAGYPAILDTVTHALAALKAPSSSPATPVRLAMRPSRAATSADRARAHRRCQRAQIGSSLGALDGSQQLSSSRNTSYSTRLSDVQDEDFACAATEQPRRQAIFEAVTKSDSSVSQRSPFDFL